MSETAVAAPEHPTAIAKADPKSIAVGNRGLVPTNLEELWRFAGIVAASGFAPQGMNQSGIFISVQMGLEIGLSPMQAMQCTAVINGRPSIYGDAAKGLIEASGLLESYSQWYECDGKRLTTAEGYSRTPQGAELNNDTLVCCVMSKRRGREPLVTTFSKADAMAAGLWGKATWKQYPARMLMWRARGFNLRDNFGDVLKGLRTVEEVLDSPLEVLDAEVTPTAQPPVDALAEKLRKRAKSVASNGKGPQGATTDPIPTTTMPVDVHPEVEAVATAVAEEQPEPKSIDDEAAANEADERLSALQSHLFRLQKPNRTHTAEMKKLYGDRLWGQLTPDEQTAELQRLEGLMPIGA